MVGEFLQPCTKNARKAAKNAKQRGSGGTMNRKQGATIRLTLAESPCQDCPTRSPGCHSHCEAYAAFRKECEALAEAQRARSDYNDYIRQTISRFPGERKI